MAASTRLTCVFGSAPNSVAAPENSLDFETTWACTSRPRMISQLPVRPSMSVPLAVIRSFPRKSIVGATPCGRPLSCDGPRATTWGRPYVDGPGLQSVSRYVEMPVAGEDAGFPFVGIERRGQLEMRGRAAQLRAGVRADVPVAAPAAHLEAGPAAGAGGIAGG